MKYDIYKASRLGNRTNNQDRVGVVETEHAILMVIADGLGGYKGGELAASTVVDCAIRHFNGTEFPIRNPGTLVNEIIMRAQREVISVSQACDPPLHSKSTCVVCIVQDGIAYWGHLGDSRLYIIRNESIIQRTVDHSKVEDLFRKGLITESQKMTHPEKHVITRCIGSENRRPKPSVAPPFALNKGDVLLLSTDGFWGPLSDKDITTGLNLLNLQDAIENLASDADENSYPQSDNISVIALRWLSEMQKSTPGQAKTNAFSNTNSDIDNVNKELEDMIKKLKNIVGK